MYFRIFILYTDLMVICVEFVYSILLVKKKLRNGPKILSLKLPLGRVFEGKIFRKSHKFLDSSKLDMFDFMTFVTAFRKITALVMNSFSVHTFKSWLWRNKLITWDRLKISKTFKFHKLLWHFEDCLDNLGEHEKLSLWSEQATSRIKQTPRNFENTKWLYNEFYLSKVWKKTKMVWNL